jgi:NAD(P)-dependent dehydrogenase (short-subunit alcohol dehydrogenase family)
MSSLNNVQGEQEGRVALVTGGSSGIGRGAANELARQGAAVVVHGLTIDEAQLVVQEIRIAGGRAVPTAGPIDDPETTRAAVSLALSEFGQLDLLVTSAGIQRYGTAVDTPVEVWDEVFNVNVKGVFLASQAALPEIRKSAAGAIAIIASVQATATQANVAAYTSSKGALLSLARAMAVDEGPYGVRVNSISPGTIDTPMLRNTASLLSDGSSAGMQALVDDWGSAHALGRTGTIQELGAVISFVTSPRASFMTGDDIRVDGGLLARLAAAAPKEGKK